MPPRSYLASTVSQHSSFLQDPLLERARRAPRLACSLIRRTFRSPVVTPDLCHMQWQGASRSAFPPDESRPHWCAHSPPELGTLCFLMTSSTHSLSASLDAPFSCNELVAALSKCHESAPDADCLPHSLFKVQLRPVPRCGSVRLEVQPRRPGHPSAMVTPPPLILIVSFLSHLALSKFTSTYIYARIAPHILPQLDPSQGGFR